MRLLGELKLSTSDADDGFRGKRKLLKNNWEGWDARKQTSRDRAKEEK